MGRDPGVRAQVRNLKIRIDLIRWCQAFGVFSLLGCVASMLFLVANLPFYGSSMFVVSLVLMALSLLLSLWEILISGGALNVYLNEMTPPANQTSSPDE